MSHDRQPGAEARHRIANLLHTYTGIADRKDVEAAVALLGSARVAFPSGGYDRPGQAAAFFAALWASPLPHRHDVSNLVVVPGEIPGTWTARAHYTRWVFDPGPVLHTLGEYTLVVREPGWAVTDLTVTRTWTTI
ncbi:nuclear transport factor 2 family protein [Microbispora sp. NPDC046933]|uniref:nuclear transport factor 2 family protein n=1 Tax=Microbispora sp. NPDC046933 TaxID=3155618 RepID=UPI0033E526B4